MKNTNTTTLIQKPRISVSISRKVNLGNYQSKDFFVSLASDTDNDVVEKQVEDMLNRCEEVLSKRVESELKEKK